MEKCLQEFLALVKENPDLPVICFVNSDVVCDDSYATWLAEIGYAEVGEYALYNERYYDDRDDFKENYYDRNDEILCERFGYDPRKSYLGAESKYTKEEIESNKRADSELENYLNRVANKAFKRAIILRIGVPDDIEEFKDETDI